MFWVKFHGTHPMLIQSFILLVLIQSMKWQKWMRERAEEPQNCEVVFIAETMQQCSCHSPRPHLTNLTLLSSGAPILLITRRCLISWHDILLPLWNCLETAMDTPQLCCVTSECLLPVIHQNTTHGRQVLPDTDCAAILPHDRHMHLSGYPCDWDWELLVTTSVTRLLVCEWDEDTLVCWSVIDIELTRNLSEMIKPMLICFAHFSFLCLPGQQPYWAEKVLSGPYKRAMAPTTEGTKQAA